MIVIKFLLLQENIGLKIFPQKYHSDINMVPHAFPKDFLTSEKSHNRWCCWNY